MEKQMMHIYVVDDDKVYRKSLVRLLKSGGYFVEQFPSAQSFLDSVPIDFIKGVLILDLRMPEMDGFELQDKLNELRSDMKIIFITAHSNPGDRDHAIEQGAIGFLLKPFQQESLFNLIEDALNNSN